MFMFKSSLKVNFLALLCSFLCIGVFLTAQTTDTKAKPFSKKLDETVQISNAVNINTSEIEFSPTFYQEGIVYVAQHRRGTLDKQTGQTYFELFYSDLDANGRPGKRSLFSYTLNSRYNEGPVSFSNDGKTIYFTRNSMDKGVLQEGKDGRTHLKIYEAKKGIYEWEDIVELELNGDDFGSMHPTLSVDGTKLFFASSRKGGFGGLDIWFVQRMGDKWSTPINMGDDINTDKNEMFPFIHESGVLFFTSDGHKGFGGLDLFMIDISTNDWGEVLNLGQPFNTKQDDLSIVLNNEGTQGYLASSRPGGYGQDDIYFFSAPKGIRGVKMTKPLRHNLVVIDGQTKKKISGAQVSFLELSSDGLMENKEYYNFDLEPIPEENGQLKLKLIEKPKNEIELPYETTNKFGVVPMDLGKGKEYMIIVNKSGYFSREIVYSTSKELFNNEIQVELEPSNCLDLNGQVLNEFNNAPVSGVTVTLKNKCDNTEEVLTSNYNGQFFTCLPIGCNFEIVGVKPGFSNGNSTVSTERIRSRRSVMATVKMEPSIGGIQKIENQPIRVGTIIVLEDIYYDFNKSYIREGAAKGLEALAKLLNKYPSMKIELGAHTDTRGKKNYNLKLSLERAEAAKRFLEKRGIQSERINAIGFGEAYPRNRCIDEVECSEDEHAYNRRTEVRITEMKGVDDLKFGTSKKGK